MLGSLSRITSHDLWTYEYLLKSKRNFSLSCRGETELKGKGMVKTYWLDGCDGYNKILPKGAPDNGKSHGLHLEDYMDTKEIEIQRAIVAESLKIVEDDADEDNQQVSRLKC